MNAALACKLCEQMCTCDWSDSVS